MATDFRLAAALCFIFLIAFSSAWATQVPENWREYIHSDMLINNDEADRYDSNQLEGGIVGLNAIELPHGVVGNASENVSLIWPDNTIPYEFSRTQLTSMSASEEQIILESMDIISHLTGNCVKFVERTSEDDYISFRKGRQCLSHTHRMGGIQFVTFASGCLQRHGNVQHALMLVMGFFHEHSRQDRDQYIKIIWDNISANREQFIQRAGDTYDLPYDYESIMHYKFNAFAKDDELPTILPLRKQARIGQTDNLSPLDIARIHRRFGCSPAAAVNYAGLPHSRLCVVKPEETPPTAICNNFTRDIEATGKPTHAEADEHSPNEQSTEQRSDMSSSTEATIGSSRGSKAYTSYSMSPNQSASTLQILKGRENMAGVMSVQDGSNENTTTSMDNILASDPETLSCTMFGLLPKGVMHTSGTMSMGTKLFRGDSLRSPNGLARLMLDRNGNLRLYRKVSLAERNQSQQQKPFGCDWEYRRVCSSQTSGQQIVKAEVRREGDLVLVNERNEVAWRSPVTYFGRSFTPGGYLRVQDDGNIVVYDKEHRPIWSPNSHVYFQDDAASVQARHEREPNNGMHC